MPFALITGPLAGPALTLVRLADKSPEPEDVKAGWTAFAIFLLLAAAVALLGFSLVKQLRKAQAAKDAGVYGDQPAATEADTAPATDSEGQVDGPSAEGRVAGDRPADGPVGEHPAEPGAADHRENHS